MTFQSHSTATTSTAPTAPIPTLSAPASGATLLATLLRFVNPHRTLYLVGLVALLIGSGINLLFPEIVRRLLAPHSFDFVVAHQTSIVLAIAAIVVVQGVAFFLRSYLLGILGQRVYADLREQLFSSVLSKDIGFFDSTRSSDIAARINSDAALVQDAVSVKLSILVRYGIQVLCGVVLMVAMSWRLTVATVVSVGLLVGISLLFVGCLRRASRAYQSELARFTSFAAECFSGVKVIRVLGATRHVAEGAHAHNQATLRAGERRVWWSASFSSAVSALLNVVLILVAWYGLALVGYGTLPLHELAAFILYGAIVAVSFSFCIGAYAELMQGLGGLERVFELIEPSDSNQNVTESVSLRPRRSEFAEVQGIGVMCHALEFCYTGRQSQPALDTLSLAITSGSMLGIVGPSGCGKSTLVQILCGLYRPDKGTVEFQIGGSNRALRDLSAHELSALVGWVPQEPQLFGMSIFNNLTLGATGLTRDEVLKVIHSWEFLDFIHPLEYGVDTVLGEQGALLSGGQRQRLAIARALLRKPALLILDEATSGLDSESEAAVMRAIRQFIPKATIVVVSHRLATVAQADTIIVVEDGRVVQQGTHVQLSTTPGVYQQYNKRQSLSAASSHIGIP